MYGSFIHCRGKNQHFLILGPRPPFWAKFWTLSFFHVKFVISLPLSPKPRFNRYFLLTFDQMCPWPLDSAHCAQWASRPTFGKTQSFPKQHLCLFCWNLVHCRLCMDKTDIFFVIFVHFQPQRTPTNRIKSAIFAKIA